MTGARTTETVMQRAVRRYADLSEADLVGLAKWKADTVRAIAIKFLQDDGVVLVGDPSVIEYAIARASADIAGPWEQLTNGQTKPKRGRPARGYDTLTLYAAAHWLFMSDGVSTAEAAKRAAHFLGAPATKDRVEKGTKGWLRASSKILTVGGGKDTVRRFLLKTLADTAAELGAIAGELAAEQKTEAARRKAARHASFIGAAPGRSLSNLKRETKR